MTGNVQLDRQHVERKLQNDPYLNFGERQYPIVTATLTFHAGLAFL